MRERTVRIGSAGKTFSLTGWKVGYVTAAPRAARPDHQGAPVHHLHHAAGPAEGGRLRPRQGRRLLRRRSPATSQAKRDRFAAGLDRVGFDVVPCAGTYFITADVRSARRRRRRRRALPADDDRSRASPPSRSPPSTSADAPRNFVRFCFSKRDAVLDGALDRLARWVEQAQRRRGLDRSDLGIRASVAYVLAYANQCGGPRHGIHEAKSEPVSQREEPGGPNSEGVRAAGNGSDHSARMATRLIIEPVREEVANCNC